MKKYVIAAMCVFPTLAFGADLPSRVLPPAYSPPPPPPTFSWSGFYAGVNAGYAFDTYQRFGVAGNDALSAAVLAAGFAPNYFQTRARGFTGGGQIGYNFELGGNLMGGAARLPTSLLGGGLVAGLEADAAYTRLRGEEDYLAGGVLTQARTSLDFLGTVRGRLGLAYQTVFVYGTGGFAYGNVRDTVVATAPGLGVAYAGQTDRLRSGYVYGGGVEFAVPTVSFINVFHSSAVTIKAEFLRYDLGPASGLVVGQGAFAGSSFTVRGRVAGDIARVGINYKFDTGAPSAPIVARY